MPKTHMKKYTIFLAIKEMQIQTTLSIHLNPLELLPSRIPPTTIIGKNMGRKERSHTGFHYGKWHKTKNRTPM
jgi:hypothetical protein